MQDLQSTYEEALVRLDKYVRNNTDFSVRVETVPYPFRVELYDGEQMTFDELGRREDDATRMTVSVGLETRLTTDQALCIETDVIKEIIRLTEYAAQVFYQLFTAANTKAEGKGSPHDDTRP